MTVKEMNRRFGDLLSKQDEQTGDIYLNTMEDEWEFMEGENQFRHLCENAHMLQVY